MANTIKIKRGLSSNIDNTTLAQGELAITTDTNELYVGVEGGKKKLGSDVVIIYDTDDESTVVKKLAEATDGPDLTGNPAKIKKECIYYEMGAPEWSRIYKLVYIASTVVDSPHTSVTFSGGYRKLTMKIERGEKVNGEYQYTITKTTDSYEQTSNKIDEIGAKSYISSSEYPSEKAVVDYVNERAVQSDYNQNDEKAADYIKNRPFYENSNIIFQGDVTFTKGGEFEEYSGTVPFSTSFKKDDFKKVWRLQILYEEKQEKLRRYSWNYENGQDNNFEYFSYFISAQGIARAFWNGVHIVSSDTALKIDIPADGDTASTKTINITITMQTKSDTLDLMSLEDIEDIDKVLQGHPPR